MKWFLIIWIVIISPFAWGQIPDRDFYGSISKADARKAIKSSHVIENNTYANYDLIYQQMKWNINPAVKYISGAVTSHVKSLTEELSTIEFDLHNDLVVDSVLSYRKPLDFTHSENRLSIQLSNILVNGGIDSLTVYYKGIPHESESGFGSFIQSTHSGAPIIWTLSEPFGAMEWWPCKQSLSDKVDSIDIIVTSPQLYRTASNGVLVSEQIQGNQRIMHWKSRYPIATYLVAISVTNYEDYSDYVDLENGDSIEILNYVYPEALEDARENTPRTIEIMKLYNGLFGLYPFSEEKYGHAQFGWGGGMEHQTMSFMGSFNFELIAHELAHQWFGDYATLSSWHDIWLNEGFATYLAGISYENLLSGEYWIPWKTMVLERIVSQEGGSVYVQDTTSIPRIFDGRLSYRKGAYLLHMLRWVLGGDTFFSAIRNYLSDPDVANGFASQAELVNHLELEGDTTLTEFFNDWYYGEGYPIYTLQYVQRDNMEVVLIVNQQTSHNSVPFFEMPIPIRVWNEDSSMYKDFRLQHDFNGQSFTLHPGFKVSKIEFDPDLWLISSTNLVLNSTLIEQNDELMIFPNPTNGQMKLVLNDGSEINSISVFGMNGEEIFRNVELQKGNNINLSFLKKGVYIIRVVSGGKDYQKKIIVN